MTFHKCQPTGFDNSVLNTYVIHGVANSLILNKTLDKDNNSGCQNKTVCTLLMCIWLTET